MLVKKIMQTIKVNKKTVATVFGILALLGLGYQLYAESKCAGSQKAKQILCDTQRLRAQQEGLSKYEAIQQTNTVACRCAG